MTKIKSGAICLLFSYALFFNLPVIWLLVLKEFFFSFTPSIFSPYFIHLTYSACIVYGSGTGAGDLVRFGYL